MAKRKAHVRPAAKQSARKSTPAARKATRPAVKRKPARQVTEKRTVKKPKSATAKPRTAKKSVARRSVSKARRAPIGPAKPAPRRAAKAVKNAPAIRRPRTPRGGVKAPTPTLHTPARISRERRVLPDDLLPSPPSSLDLNRHASAAASGRAEMAQHRSSHATMTPSIAAGDADVNVEDAYFTGDEAPGGDNPTPDQDVVDEIGVALGLEYGDSEELKSSDKLIERDKHRWELDPASSEDYRDREQGKE